MTSGPGQAVLGSVAESLEALGQFGAGAGSGITRLAWSAELFAAYDWVAGRMRGLGLDVEIDAAGNLIGRWNVGEGSPVAIGSHLDTVPSGGHFDGALGVIAGLHAVAQLQREGFVPKRPVWVIAFMDEEGTRFDAALFGSRAFAGEDVSELGGRADADGITLAAAMRAAGFELEAAGAASRAGELRAYYELHVEQGPVLESIGADIGVVTAIVGRTGYRVRLLGQANHSGTTPMTLRRDAFAGVARIALELREYARAGRDLTANVGKISLEPGGANVVPGIAEFTIDARAADAGGLRAFEGFIEQTVRRVAGEERLEAEVSRVFALDPLELDAQLVGELGAAAASEGASVHRMPSGAGHDAMVIGRHVPAGMIFVPSRNGISHSPDEHTDASQLELGARVLTAVLRRSLSDGRPDVDKVVMSH